MEDLLALSYKGARLGFGVASSLISSTGESAPDLSAAGAKIARDLRVSAEVFESARALILAHQPKSILTFNGRFACSKPVVEAARLAGVPYQVHDCGALFNRFDVQHDSLHDTGKERQRLLIRWANGPLNKADIARTFFERRRAGDGMGWQSHTINQMPGSVPAARFPRRVVYFMSNDDEFSAIVDYSSHTIFASQRSAVEFLVHWARSRADVELIIRLHPMLVERPLSDRRYWESLKQGTNVLVDPPDSETDSYALAESADVVVTYGSTMGAEAAYLGRPVILLAESQYSGLDCVHEPHSLPELEALLNQTRLQAKPKENCLPFGYHSMTYGTPFQHYEATPRFDGAFMGTELTIYPQYLGAFIASPVGKQLLKVLRVARTWR
jgi:hypothetical protein